MKFNKKFILMEIDLIIAFIVIMLFLFSSFYTYASTNSRKNSSWEEHVKDRIIASWYRHQDFILTFMKEISLSQLIEYYNGNIPLPKWLPSKIKLTKIYYCPKDQSALLVYCSRNLIIPKDNIFLHSNLTIMIMKKTIPISPKNRIELTDKVYAYIIEGKPYTTYTIEGPNNEIIAQGKVDIPGATRITFNYKGLAYAIRGYLDKDLLIRIVKSIL